MNRLYQTAGSLSSDGMKLSLSKLCRSQKRRYFQRSDMSEQKGCHRYANHQATPLRPVSQIRWVTFTCPRLDEAMLFCCSHSSCLWLSFMYCTELQYGVAVSWPPLVEMGWRGVGGCQTITSAHAQNADRRAGLVVQYLCRGLRYHSKRLFLLVSCLLPPARCTGGPARADRSG